MLLAATFAAVACSKAHNREISGETHFLTACNADTGECGAGLICACGLCTRACVADAECSALPSATCRASTEGALQSCEPAAPAARCDAVCVSDAECLAISNAHRCWSGLCRAGEPPAGTGGTAGTGGGAGTGGTDSAGGSAGAGGSDSAGAGGEAPGTGCEVEGNEVLVLGDSFMAAGHRITARIEELARAAGALEIGQRFRDESTTTTNALAPGVPGIADQYTRAIEEAPVSVVVMNGGGADMLLGACESPPSAECPAISAAVGGARDLFQRMGNDGVTHIVYAFYPDPPEGDLRARMDTLRPLVEAACSESAAPCHFLDLRPVFEGHYAEYVGPEGLNPTAAGAVATGDAIWATLQQACAAP